MDVNQCIIIRKRRIGQHCPTKKTVQSAGVSHSTVREEIEKNKSIT